MRSRVKRGKLKLEHHLVGDLRRALERIAEWPQVASVIPGRIRRAGGRRPGLELTAGVDTRTGVKLTAKSRDGGVQEVFVVTSDPRAVRSQLVEMMTRGDP